MKKLLFLLILPMLLTDFSRACTAFCYCTEHLSILAKNLDWSVDEGLILTNRSGVKKSSFTNDGIAVTWISQYKSITFNQFGKEFPLGGMNAQGLVVEELNMPAIQRLPDSTKVCLNEFQVVQYMLDNFATVIEVEDALVSFQLRPLLLSLHYLLMDREGRVRIMEFDGSDFVFHNPEKFGYPVLSNNRYEESLRYLKNYKGFGGEQEVKHRSGSNERFVSVAFMLSECHTSSAVNYCFDILDTVSQPDTRWSLVYDATNLCIYLKFHACPHRQVIQLEELLSTTADVILGAQVSECRKNGSFIFRAMGKEENSDLIRTVVNQLNGEMDVQSKGSLFRKMISYSNTYIIE